MLGDDVRGKSYKATLYVCLCVLVSRLQLNKEQECKPALVCERFFTLRTNFRKA